jgi:alkylhydroperoxidase family enzyme
VPRLRQVAKSELVSRRVIDTYRQRFGDRDPVEQPATTSGAPGSWWTVFALDEALFEHMLDRHDWQFSSERKLPAALRELALARTGWVAESSFVFAQHCKLLQRLGTSEDKIAAIPSWASRSCWTEVERLVLAYTDGLAGGRGRVDDSTFAAVRTHFTDVQILELTFMVCTYVSSATLCRALRLELDDRGDPVTDAYPARSV